jgi:hypothetical protein
MSEEDSTASSASIVEDTPSENGSEPTAAERQEVIPEVTNWLNDFHLGSDMAPQPASVLNAPAGDSSGIKVNAPQEFRGDKGTMERFRMQCLLAIEMSGNKLSTDRKQVLYIVSFLRGPAYEWIHPHFKDFLQNAEGAQKAFTKKIFKDYESLFDEMEEVFDNGDEALEADRDIRALRQRTSVAQYRAEFQILAAKLDWNDDALASEFYRGLKDRVREEITLRNDRPSNLKDLSELAIKIDNRIFELQLEKRGSYAQNNGANRKAKRNVPEWNDNYYGLQKMQLDATKGKPGSNHNKGSKNNSNKRPQSKTKGTTDKSNVECYGCGKKGHYKSECNARKQRHDLQGSGQRQSQDNSFRATKGSDKEVVETPRVESLKATQGRGGYQEMEPIATQDPHGMESWTACFDDECAIHLSDKFGSGYWPAKRTRSVCLAIGGPSQVIRYPAGYPPQTDSTEEEESSEEEGELVEISDPESDGEVEESPTTEFTRTVSCDDAILQVLELVWDAKGLILPWNGDGDEQMVNERELWILIGKIRTALWAMPHEKNSTDYTKIVQEHPPLGSTFSTRASYMTQEGITVSREMRYNIYMVRVAFSEEAARQARQNGAQYSSGSMELYTLPRRADQPTISEEPEEVRRQPTARQNRPPTPYVRDPSVWEPPLTTSDPNYVPRRQTTRSREYLVNPVGISPETVQQLTQKGTQAEGSLDPRRQLVMGRTKTWNTGN